MNANVNLAEAAQSAAEMPVELLPILGDNGRYQVSVTIGASTYITRTDDADAAIAALDAFEARMAGDKDAHGAVYDFDALKQIKWVWCAPKVGPKVHPLEALFLKAIKSGAPVSIIGDAGAVHFNDGARS